MREKESEQNVDAEVCVAELCVAELCVAADISC